MRLTTRNKVLISGIAGAVVLIVGFSMLMSSFFASQAALDQQIPGREQDGVPGGFGLAFMGILLLALSGIVSGICYTGLDREETMKNTIIRAATSGAAAGLLCFLATCALIIANALGSGLMQALVGLFMAAFYIALVFIVLSLVLAVFAALGGAAAKLAMKGVNKIKRVRPKLRA